MASKKYDFWGWATKNDLKCSDGRTIRQNAFKDCDGTTVPLVWNHQHNDPDNVLGHALLKNSDKGVIAYGFFNNLPKSQRIKSILQHGDICSLSIFANGLKQTAEGDVLHGVIREVSLVLAGANPGASIEYVMAHSADEDFVAVGAEIYTGEELVLEHDDESEGIEIVEDPEETTDEEVEEESEEISEEDPKEESEAQEEVSEEKEELAHADKEENDIEGDDEMAEKNEDLTVQDVLDGMTEDQRKVVEYLVGEALASGGDEDEEYEEDEEDMKHNAFDGNGSYEDELIHGEIMEALGNARKCGSAKEALMDAGFDPSEVLVHDAMNTVTNINYLYPEYQNVHGSNLPMININPNGWVSVINSGVHHTPFAKIKMVFADVTADTARAKGYVKGAAKVNEVITMLKREVNPTTIYKKQGFDRDDIIDITDIDLIAWVKQEMRTKLDEERARAYIFGDGRNPASPDKINEASIIPVVNDTANNLYAMAYEVTPETDESLAHAIVNSLVKGLDDYEGSGNVTAFVRSDIVSDMLLMEDMIGQRLYKNMNELASAMSVDKVVKVPASVMPEDVYGVALDLKDYNVGTNKGGEVSLFDDFDIDYNQMKYLIEARCSGALILPHSAIVLKEAGAGSL